MDDQAGQIREASSKAKQKQKQKVQKNPNAGKGASRLRGLEKDSIETRISKTLSYILRHGAVKEGIPMRSDGYVKVTDLIENPKLKGQSLDLDILKRIVAADSKQRYDLIFEPDPNNLDESNSDIWWIKARQGHSLESVKLNLKSIASATDIPTCIAVHGTNPQAWKLISKKGLSRMTRNHIHLAQGIPGDNVISGMRSSSEIFIYIDVQKALNAGIKFSLSDNGVVLSEGNGKGFIPPEYFVKVENAKREVLTGWEPD